MKKVFASALAALLTFAACSDKEITPDQDGKEDQEQTEEPGGENPGENPGEDPGEDPGTTPPPATFEWPNDPTAFDYEIDMNESRRAEYVKADLTAGGITSQQELKGPVTVDGITYGGPGITYYGNRMTTDQVRKGFFSEEYPDVIPSRCYQSFKINRPGSVSFFQSIGTKPDNGVIRIPAYYMAVITTVNGVTSAKIVDEFIPDETGVLDGSVSSGRPGNPYSEEFLPYHVTLTVTAEDLAGITEPATVFIYHRNTKFNSLLVHYYPITWTSGAETNASQRKPKFLLAGDSLVTEYGEGSAPQAGWGQRLAQFLGEDVKVRNHAVGGESTQSFINNGRWEGLVSTVLANDIVLIQFMHNDKNSSREGYRTDAGTTYKDNLKKFISETREKGGVPVLVTSLLPRQFNSDGTAKRSLGDFPDAMRAVATETETPLVDVEQWSYDWLTGLGAEGSEPYYLTNKRDPEGNDNVHVTYDGADIVAKYIADELVRLGVWTR